MTRSTHAARIGSLMILAALFLSWKASRAEILFADGLRYIEQAQRIDRGSIVEGLLKSVDHPVYPLAIAASHRLIGGEGPIAWQRASQVAAIVAGVLLVVPIYLVTLEVFGAQAAWLACVLTFLVPLTGQVLADTLSEGTFLLFWTWGLWAALRFLREGAFRWLPLTIVFGGLAYLSRPEGLLLPAALVATLVLMPLMRSTRLNWPRWWAAVAFLIISPALMIGPFVAIKGGLGTKPAIARLLGTAPKSPNDAVERQRPLDPNQSTAKTYLLAVRAMAIAVRDSSTIPVLLLSLLGLGFAWPSFGGKARVWLFVAIIGCAATVALVRLHATGGYCSARHAMVIALLIIPAAASGLEKVLGSIVLPGRWIGLEEGTWTAGPAFWALALIGLTAFNAPGLLAPINEGLGGYRAAGAWLEANTPAGTRIVDVTGWSQYYGRRPGYTFANLIEAPGDRELRWVVVRDAHLSGPWTYCKRLRELVAGLEPKEVFPESPQPRQAQVFLFDRASKIGMAENRSEGKKY